MAMGSNHVRKSECESTSIAFAHSDMRYHCRLVRSSSLKSLLLRQ